MGTLTFYLGLGIGCYLQNDKVDLTTLFPERWGSMTWLRNERPLNYRTRTTKKNLHPRKLRCTLFHQKNFIDGSRLSAQHLITCFRHYDVLAKTRRWVTVGYHLFQPKWPWFTRTHYLVLRISLPRSHFCRRIIRLTTSQVLQTHQKQELLFGEVSSHAEPFLRVAVSFVHPGHG